MNYYRDLLDEIIRSTSSDDSPRVLSLKFGGVAGDAHGQRDVSRTFELPENFIPTNSDCRVLSEDESFVASAAHIVNEANSTHVFAFPPFLGYMRLSQEFRDEYKGLGVAEALASVLMADEITPRVLTLLVPSQFLETARCGKWRKEFFPAHSAFVIEHDHDLQQHFSLPVHVSVRFATIVFLHKSGPVRFLKITEEAIEAGTSRIIRDVNRLLRQPAGKSQFGYVHTGLLEEGYPTSYDYYSEQTERLRQEVGELGQRVRLEQIADILVGYRPLRPESSDESDVGEYLSVNAADITADGRVDLSNVKLSSKPVHIEHFLKEGDICIRQIYHSGGGFILGVYQGDGRSITWGNSVLVVRPHSSVLPAQRQVLLSFLRSPLAQRLGNAKQTMSSLGGQLRLTPHVLREFPVPIADKEIVAALQDLNDARDAFHRWISEIDDASNAIVKEATASGSRNRILKSGQLARQRFRAGNQVEDLDYRIRTQFPHPLAYIWQEVRVAGPDPYHRLRAITKAGEGHTCFLAQICFLLGRVSGKSLSYVDTMAERFSTRQGGTNFGDWFAIVKEVNESRAFRNLGADLPFSELRRLCSEGAWEPAARYLMEVRNDDSHGRIAPRGVTTDLLVKAGTALETLYRATEFLTDYRLFVITETRFDSIRKVTRYQYRDLSGDGVLPPLNADETMRSDLETGSLYLRDRQGEIHLLRPLLQYLECPECHQMSTFFFDTYDGTGGSIVGIKSFERNSVRREAMVDEFRHIGLLR